MSSHVKIVYEDSGKEIAITGEIVKEDEFFIELQDDNGKPYRIGKKSITVIKGIA